MTLQPLKELDFQYIVRHIEQMSENYLPKEYGVFHNSRPDAATDNRVGLLQTEMHAWDETLKKCVKDKDIFNQFSVQEFEQIQQEILKTDPLKPEDERRRAQLYNRLIFLNPNILSHTQADQESLDKTKCTTFAQYAQKTKNYPQVRRFINKTDASDEDEKQVNKTLDMINPLIEQNYNTAQALIYATQTGTLNLPTTYRPEQRIKQVNQAILTEIEYMNRMDDRHSSAATVRYKQAQFNGEKKAFDQLYQTLTEMPQWEEVKSFMSERAKKSENQSAAFSWSTGNIEDIVAQKFPLKAKMITSYIEDKELGKDAHILEKSALEANESEQQFVLIAQAFQDYHFAQKEQTQEYMEWVKNSKIKPVNPYEIPVTVPIEFNTENYHISELVQRTYKCTENNFTRAIGEEAGSAAGFAVASTLVAATAAAGAAATAGTGGAAAPGAVVTTGAVIALGMTMDDQMRQDGKTAGEDWGNAVLNKNILKEINHTTTYLENKKSTFQTDLNSLSNKKEALDFAITSLRVQMNSADKATQLLLQQKLAVLEEVQAGKSFYQAAQGITTFPLKEVPGEKMTDANGVEYYKYQDSRVIDKLQKTYVSTLEAEIEFCSYKNLTTAFQKAQDLAQNRAALCQSPQKSSLVLSPSKKQFDDPTRSFLEKNTPVSPKEERKQPQTPDYPINTLLKKTATTFPDQELTASGETIKKYNGEER